jgi:hypothetical protein
MSFIGGAAHGVPHDDHPIAEIHCTKNGCKYAEVSFRASDNQAVSLYRVQEFRKTRLNEGGVPCLIYNLSGWTELGKRWEGAPGERDRVADALHPSIASKMAATYLACRSPVLAE